MMEKLNLDRALRRKALELGNKLMAARLSRLELLRENYQDHLLGLGLKDYQTKFEAYYTRAKSATCNSLAERIKKLEEHLNKEEETLNKEQASLELKLNKHRMLDKNLVAEYRRLKDDIECQMLLLEYSENNGTT